MASFHTLEAMQLAKQTDRKFFSRINELDVYTLSYVKGANTWECHLVQKSKYMDSYQSCSIAHIPELAWQIKVDPPELGVWYKLKGGNYFQITSYDEETGMAETQNIGKHAPTKVSYNEFEKMITRVTNENKLLFLNHGRHPVTWEVGDLYTLGDEGPIRTVTPKDLETLSSQARLKNEAQIVCFVENRLDYKEEQG